MKPFNLEEALAGRPLVTRDGCRVIEFVAADDGCEVMPYKAIQESGFTFYCTPEGEVLGRGGPINSEALFMAEEDEPKEATA